MSVHADVTTQLAGEARRLGALGFMACTAGNLSARLEHGRIAMSRSGVDKGALEPGDFIVCDAEGRPLPGDQRKPSDETLLHCAIYRLLSEVGAVCHGHPPHAVALSLVAEREVALEGVEMQKAFAGTTTHLGRRILPVIENSQDMQDLARWTEERRVPDVPAVLVRGHGVYAWGRTVAEAGRHLEAVEYLCRLEVILRGMGASRARA